MLKIPLLMQAGNGQSQIYIYMWSEKFKAATVAPLSLSFSLLQKLCTLSSVGHCRLKSGSRPVDPSWQTSWTVVQLSAVGTCCLTWSTYWRWRSPMVRLDYHSLLQIQCRTVWPALWRRNAIKSLKGPTPKKSQGQSIESETWQGISTFAEGPISMPI